MPNRANPELLTVAAKACELARRAGAKDAAARASRTRSVQVMLRNSQLEELKSAESRTLTLKLFADGRYSQHTLHSFDEVRLADFVKNAVEMTRFLMADPLRSLPDPASYAERSKADLELYDPAYETVTPAQRRQLATLAHDAARAAAGEALISVRAGYSDSASEWALQQTNGFADGDRATSYSLWAGVSVRDPSGKRPSDGDEQSVRRLVELADPARVGRRAAQRALRAIGAETLPSCTLPLIVENRAGGRLLSGLLAPLDGRALDQKQSCYDGSSGQQVAAARLTILDDPLLPGGWGSRRFDEEGLSCQQRAVIEAGVLRSFFVDTYYAKKLKQPPTSGEASNLVFPGGATDLAGLMAQAGKAVLVTGFLGGNSNSTTGDFSHGIRGFLVEGGKPSRPIAAMNVSGNHTRLWRELRALGNDPYPYSSRRCPSLLFAPMLVAGQ